MSDHAKLSPSAAHRWRRCPGSVREEANYVRNPDVPNSPASVDGTHTHTLLDHCLKMAVNEASGMVGMLLSDHEGHFIVDPERAERVQFALDYIIKRRNELGNGCSVISESAVSLRNLTGRDDLDGTVDVALYNGDVLEIIDYKDGVGEVSAIENEQMEQYAFGVLSSMPDGALAPKMIRMTIVQPKLRLFGKDGIGVWNVTYEQFMVRLENLKFDARKTDHEFAPLVPGEKQCQWCKHKGNCEAQSQKALKEIGMHFSPVGAPIIVQSAELPDPKTLSAQRLRQVIEALPMITGWLESVEEAALRQIELGTPIDGLKVVRGRGSRSWAKDEETVADKLNKMGMPKAEIWQTKVISIAQLEKAKFSWKNNKGENKCLTPKQKELIMSELVSTSTGALKVVSAADKRPAVEFQKVEDMFAPIESDAIPSWLS